MDTQNLQCPRCGAANTMAVNGQGRLYIGDRDQIRVVTGDGHLINTFPTGKYLDMITVDEQGNIWGVSRDKVNWFTLRGK